MGYDLHITRKKGWSSLEGPVISLEEWQQFVQADADLAAEPSGPGDRCTVVSYRDQHDVLRWCAGEVRSKNPNKELVIKMVAIATALGAQAQGDDGEVYQADGTEQETSPARTVKKWNWKAIFIALLCYIVVQITLFYLTSHYYS